MTSDVEFKKKKCNSLEKLINKLTTIGIQFSSEKDTEKLLDLILSSCMDITTADGGSIYLKKDFEDETKLQFTHTMNYSKEFPFNNFTLPIDSNSFAGYCAQNKTVLNLNNMEKDSKKLNIKHYKEFDEANNYLTVNMLVIPMMNYDNDLIGVLQLINKKTDPDIKLLTPKDYENHIIPFTSHEAEIIKSLASQAAILIERNILMDEIEELFKSFIESIVTSIDKRDPVTAGHSKRVANYSVSLAKKIDEEDSEPFANINFSKTNLEELFFAGLLHDVGKIGVKEKILTKNKRISDDRLNLIIYKLRYTKFTLKGKEDLTESQHYLLDNFDFIIDFLKKCNHAGFLPEEDLKILNKIKDIHYSTLDGNTEPILTEQDYTNLSIKKGNLNPIEREKMETHPMYTYEILKDIAWTDPLKEIPKIAADHHEKINGRGYPQGLEGEKISIFTRILAVADIFDALTAKDRPYKPALSIMKTLNILKEEASKGALDSDIVNIFITKQAYLIKGVDLDV